METKTIADALVTACRAGNEASLLDTHYSADAVSVEAADQGNGRLAKGLEAIRGKHAWWHEAMEVTDAKVSDPMLHGDDRFAVLFEVQGKVKATGEAFDMREVAVYHVSEGKIVREEFFY